MLLKAESITDIITVIRHKLVYIYFTMNTFFQYEFYHRRVKNGSWVVCWSSNLFFDILRAVNLTLDQNRKSRMAQIQNAQSNSHEFEIHSEKRGESWKNEFKPHHTSYVLNGKVETIAKKPDSSIRPELRMRSRVFRLLTKNIYNFRLTRKLGKERLNAIRLLLQDLYLNKVPIKN